MDKIKKFLRKLQDSELRLVILAMDKIENKDLRDLDVKKLVAYSNLFRVRIGDIRIFFIQEDSINTIVFVGRRSDTTYNF